MGRSGYHVAIDLDLAEHERRSEHEAGALERLAEIEVLDQLPLSIPISRDSLSRYQRKILEALRPGMITELEDEFVRLARRPLRPSIAVITARTWSTGGWAASQFAPFCGRVVVLPTTAERRDDFEIAVGEALLFGIGLYVWDQGEAREIVHPAPFAQLRWTAMGWFFAERLYGALCTRAEAQSSSCAVAHPSSAVGGLIFTPDSTESMAWRPTASRIS